MVDHFYIGGHCLLMGPSSPRLRRQFLGWCGAAATLGTLALSACQPVPQLFQKDSTASTAAPLPTPAVTTPMAAPTAPAFAPTPSAPMPQKTTGLQYLHTVGSKIVD